MKDINLKDRKEEYYIGTKAVLAYEEMKNGEPGYKVKYKDGYESWSPKNVFEESYVKLSEMLPNKE